MSEEVTGHDSNLGALVYYLRRVLHDWDDADCVRILQNVAKSMSPEKSRILISEQLISETNADVQATWYDMVSLFREQVKMIRQ